MEFGGKKIDWFRDTKVIPIGLKFLFKKYGLLVEIQYQMEYEILYDVRRCERDRSLCFHWLSRTYIGFHANLHVRHFYLYELSIQLMVISFQLTIGTEGIFHSGRSLAPVLI